MVRRWIAQSRLFAPLGPLTLSLVAHASGAVAQTGIQPDNTLGQERSQVIPIHPKLDQITGGAHRGRSLFHSFSEFNIEDGRTVEFSNSVGAHTIFSRVTGPNPSQFMGKLQVPGETNFFFLNPNGIMFGPNAKLDLKGSFTATTANSLVFPDGTRFSASDPTPPPLLAIDVNAPIGVVFEGQSGTITTQANLLEAGKNLSLNGKNLELLGTLKAGENILIHATENISLKNQLNVSLAPGNQLDLSAGESISGREYSINAHGVNIKVSASDIDLGNISTSTFRPDQAGTVAKAGNIDISASTGDITVQKIDAGSSVSKNGNSGEGGIISLIAKYGNISTGFLDTSSIVLGNGNSGKAGTIKIDSFGDIVSTGGLSARSQVNGNGSSGDGGIIDLKSGGSIHSPVQGLGVHSEIHGKGRSGNAGSITLTTHSGDISTGVLRAYSQAGDEPGDNGDSGNGGLVSINSGGAISIQGSGFSIGTYSKSNFSPNSQHQIRFSGSAGKINISASNNVKIDSSISSESEIGFDTTNPNHLYGFGHSGNGGDLQIVSKRGNIDIGQQIASWSRVNGNGSSGNAGNVILQALQGNISVGPINVFSTVTGSGVRQPDDNRIADVGKGGSINLESGGDIKTAYLTTSSLLGQAPTFSFGVFQPGRGSTSQAGDISLISHTGNVNLGGLAAVSLVTDQGTADRGGNVRIISESGRITVV